MRTSVLDATALRTERAALGRIVSMLILKERPLALAFIAARGGEGTSTVAHEFVRMLSEDGYKVLLVKMAAAENSVRRTPALRPAEMLSTSQQLEAVVKRADNPPYHELSLDSRSNPGLAARVAVSDEFWTGLKEIYDYVVIDSPALERTYEGAVLASRADGVVILVESEATSAADVAGLRTTLEQMDAKILGVLMTKHRNYVPARG